MLNPGYFTTFSSTESPLIVPHQWDPLSLLVCLFDAYKPSSKFLRETVPQEFHHHPGTRTTPLEALQQIFSKLEHRWFASPERAKEEPCHVACCLFSSTHLVFCSLGTSTIIFQKDDKTQTQTFTSPTFGTQKAMEQPSFYSIELVGLTYFLIIPNQSSPPLNLQTQLEVDPLTSQQILIDAAGRDKVKEMSCIRIQKEFFLKQFQLDNLLSCEYLSELISSFSIKNGRWKLVGSNQQGDEVYHQPIGSDFITMCTQTISCRAEDLIEIFHLYPFFYGKNWSPDFRSGKLIEGFDSKDYSIQHWKYGSGARDRDFFVLHRIVEFPGLGTVIAQKSINTIPFQKKPFTTRCHLDYQIRIIKEIEKDGEVFTKIIWVYLIKEPKGRFFNCSSYSPNSLLNQIQKVRSIALLMQFEKSNFPKGPWPFLGTEFAPSLTPITTLSPRQSLVLQQLGGSTADALKKFGSTESLGSHERDTPTTSESEPGERFKSPRPSKVHRSTPTKSLASPDTPLSSPPSTPSTQNTTTSTPVVPQIKTPNGIDNLDDFLPVSPSPPVSPPPSPSPNSSKIRIFQIPQLVPQKCYLVPRNQDPVFNYPIPSLEEYLLQWDGRYWFRHMCRAEYADENFDCLVMIMAYKSSSANLEKRANLIFETHLKRHAARRVNINDRIYLPIAEKIKSRNYSLQLFDPVKTALVSLLTSNLFGRFRQSVQFECWLRGKGMDPANLRTAWLRKNLKPSETLGS